MRRSLLIYVNTSKTADTTSCDLAYFVVVFFLNNSVEYFNSFSNVNFKAIVCHYCIFILRSMSIGA